MGSHRLLGTSKKRRYILYSGPEKYALRSFEVHTFFVRTLQ